MKKFTLGMVAGVSSLAIAVPLLAQMAGAASSSSTSARADWTPPVSTQACVEAMSGVDGAHLAVMDAMTAAHKTALQARKDALDAAASLADDTARQEAVQKAQETFRSAMESVQQSDAMKTAMEAMQESCGGEGFGFKRGGMGMGMGMFGGGEKGQFQMRGNAPADLAEKLGLTADELQAALESGKTIQQIAEEHGVTLPEKAGRGMRMHFGSFQSGQDTSAGSN